MKRVSVVVPCFDEAHRLRPEAFRDALRAQPGLRLVFVDDGSTDGTRRLLEALRDGDAAGGTGGRIDVVALDRNVGKAEAVRRGVLHALARSPDAFGFLDADLSTPLDEIPALGAVLAAREPVQLVMGSRVKLLGREVERRAFRHYLGRVFATCASVALGLAVYDTQCGAKLFRNSRGTRWVFRAPFRSRWLFDVEILARLGLLGRRRPRYDTARCVHEHPLHVWRDVAGSKIRLRDWFSASWELLGIALRYRCRARRGRG